MPLTIQKNSKKEGQILAHRGASISSWGENVAIFVHKISDNSTSIEVISKRTVLTNVFATDWSSVILDEVSERVE